MKTHWESGGVIHALLNSALVVPGNHCIKSGVGSRAGLEAVAKEKSPIIGPAGN
jgi:hypothetical protein